MWLRLTRKDNNKQQLYNINKVECISDLGGYTFLSTKRSSGYEVLESIDEIEIMLAGKGAEVKRTGRERDYIGQSEPFRDPTSLAMRKGI